MEQFMTLMHIHIWFQVDLYVYTLRNERGKFIALKYEITINIKQDESVHIMLRVLLLLLLVR